MAEAGMESWKNLARGKYAIKKYGERGTTVSVIIGGGKTFHLTPDERRLNSMEAASDKTDPFSNGTFVNLTIVETDDDAERIRANPAAITEPEMVELLGAHHKTFDKRLAEISNPHVLNRLLELADEDGEKVPVKRVVAIQDRLRSLDPTSAFIRRHQTVGATPDAPTTTGHEGPQDASFHDQGPRGMNTVPGPDSGPDMTAQPPAGAGTITTPARG